MSEVMSAQMGYRGRANCRCDSDVYRPDTLGVICDVRPTNSGRSVKSHASSSWSSQKYFSRVLSLITDVSVAVSHSADGENA